MLDETEIRRRAAAAVQNGEATAAVVELTSALEQAPASPELLLDLGRAQLAADRAAGAKASFERLLTLRTRDANSYRGLAQAHLALGETGQARDAFAKALAILPYDSYSAHMVAALGGETSRAATTYVADLFDEHAGQFDQHLTEVLHYRIPEAIRDLLAPHLPLASLLDLGCGTGLVGTALANTIPVMDGIDIAPQMTAKAAARNIYRHLHSGDIVTTLTSDESFAGPYDLVTAADVFVYLGALEATFALVRQRLAPAGLFAFSVESASGDDPVLRPSGRFAHPEGYITRLAAQFGFAIAEQHLMPIRHERSTPIPGMLYLLRAI